MEYKNLVLYICHCSQSVTLDELYFCRHCKLPRCNDCVSTLVDSTCISCPHCFESIPQADAKAKKNRCVHCFQCPMCASTLTTRYVMVPTGAPIDSSPENKEESPPPLEKTDRETSPKRMSIATTSPLLHLTPKSSKSHRTSFSGSSLKSPGGTKYYYLSCTHCRWTTRDAGIKDKRSPLDFKEKPHPHLEEFLKVSNYYKEIDVFERLEQERIRKQQAGRKIRPFSSLLDSSKFKVEKERPKKTFSPPEAVSPSPLSDDYYTDPVDINETCSLDQMLQNPTHQPKTIQNLLPQPLQLVGKKLLRCKGCDHILLKADVNLNTIRFKIHQIALHVFPRVRLTYIPTLTLGEPSIVPVSFMNPTSYKISLSFGPYLDRKKLKEILSPAVLPEGTFNLKSSDDDVSDMLKDQESKDSSKEEDSIFILSSEPGRLVLKFAVIPQSQENDTKIAFVMKFTYKPTIEAEGDCNDIEVAVLLNCHHTF